MSLEEIGADLAKLDAKSNRVVDLLRERRFDDAERLCRELMAEYPDDPDGLERLAETYEARGEREKAIAHYRKAAAFHRTRSSDGAEPAAYYEEKAAKLERP
jgi:DNA-binding SARP family transcriptional activator